MRSLLVVVLLVCLAVGGCGGGGGGSDGDNVTPGTNPGTTTNAAPVADAGPDQNVSTGTIVTLNASGSSDADGDLLTYAWGFVSMPAGSSAALSNAATVNPTFTTDMDGSYVLNLFVHDGKMASLADTMTVVAATANSAPAADAGPDQNVTTGTTVTLDASGSSDADGDLLTYAWSFVSRPPGSNAALSDATAATPSFTADIEGSYVLSLIVHDGAAASAADTMTVVAATANSSPVANAGPDQVILTGNPVTLNASGSSDANGDPLTYVWSFASLPEGSNATLSGATEVNPTFTPDLDGSYVLRLIVDDGTVTSTEDTVLVTSVANYSTLFLKAPQTLLFRSGGLYLTGSSFSLEIQNASTIPFVCTRAELFNGVSVEGFTEDPAFLGGEQIDPNEVVGLTYTLTRDVPVGAFEFRFYLTRPDTNENFILVHQY